METFSDAVTALAETSLVKPSGIRWLSDADIVPDEIQTELIQIGDFLTEGAFRIGDIANELIARVARSGWQVTNDRVYAAVGRFCGKSGRTVRYYAETSSFYPDDVRQEFHTAPFSHFVFARGAGSRWREALEYSAVTPGATVSELVRQFAMIDTIKSCETSHECDDNNAGSENGEYIRNFALPELSSPLVGELRETSQRNGDLVGRVVGDLVCILDRAVFLLSETNLDNFDKTSRLRLSGLLAESVNGCTGLRGVLSEFSETWYSSKHGET